MLIRRWGINTKGNEEFSTKKVLSEPNVKVVFHQTAVPVTPLSTWIIYPKRSALGHSTRCLAEAWLSEVDSLFCSRCRTCCSVDGRSSYMDPFLSVVASALPGRAGILYYKGQAKPEGCYPNRPAGGTRRGPGNHTTAVEKACSLRPSDNTHRRPSSAFFVFDEKQIKYLDLRKRFPSPSLPSSSLSFNGLVGGSIPLSELGGHSFAMGWVWFEHRLKHDWKGPSYAMRSIPKKPLGSCRDDKKRALSCVAVKKRT